MLLHRSLAASLFAVSAAAQMAGLYSVNPAWPALPTNFVSLAAAVQALAANGVAGPVTIEVYDDAGPYTEANPFLPNTLWAPSTAVLVLTSWPGASSVNRVTFRPAPGEAPVFDATGRAMGVFWGGADYVTLEGFEIANATFDAISMYADSTHGIAYDAIIRRCRLHDCGGTGVTVYGNTPNPTNTLIENCFFWRLQLTNAGSFNTTARFGYVSTRRSVNTRVIHNTFLVDTGAGSLFCALGGYPSGAAELPFAEISNNIVVKTGAAGRPTIRLNSATTTVPQLPTLSDSNCFFDGTASPFAIYGASPGTTAATLVDWQTNALRDLASFAADPLLLDPANHDFHLTPLSPCIATSAVAAGVADDVDGQPRSAPFDIGADEFSSATIAAVGSGCPGTGALVPVLSSRDWPFLGNANFALLGSRLPPFQAMLVFASFGTTTAPYPVGAGCNVWLPLGYLNGLPVLPVAGPAGTASVVVAWPPNPAYIGVNFGFQALAIDAGAPLGFTLTNAVDVVLGF